MDVELGKGLSVARRGKREERIRMISMIGDSVGEQGGSNRRWLLGEIKFHRTRVEWQGP